MKNLTLIIAMSLGLFVLGAFAKRSPIDRPKFMAVEAVTNANANFGNALFKILAKPDQNLIMSSYSVSSVLNMALNGAKGRTASQIKQGLTIKDFDVVKNGFKDALTLLKTNENFTLNAANRYVKSNQWYWNQAFFQRGLVLQIVSTNSHCLYLVYRIDV